MMSNTDSDGSGGGFTQRGPVQRTPWPNKGENKHGAIACLNGNVLAGQNNMKNVDDTESPLQTPPAEPSPEGEWMH
jgi:hypothetical protein